MLKSLSRQDSICGKGNTIYVWVDLNVLVTICPSINMLESTYLTIIALLVVCKLLCFIYRSTTDFPVLHLIGTSAPVGGSNLPPVAGSLDLPPDWKGLFPYPTSEAEFAGMVTAAA